MKISDEQLERRDRQDVMKCAELYLILSRCRKCWHLTNKGYVCQHCDDSNPSEAPDCLPCKGEGSEIMKSISGTYVVPCTHCEGTGKHQGQPL